MSFPIVNCMYRWDGREIPFAPADKKCVALLGDWSYIEGEDPARTVPRTVAAAVSYAARNTSMTYGLLDLEGRLLDRYAEIAIEIYRALPHMKLGCWAGDQHSLPQDLTDAIRDGKLGPDACILASSYQHYAETPYEAMMDARRVWDVYNATYRGYPIMPCLSVELGWCHPLYPTGRDSVGPLTSPQNLRARIEAYWALKSDFSNLKGVMIWGSALNADDARAAAITEIGRDCTSSVNVLRSYVSSYDFRRSMTL